jgi:7-carboxy-7-deazaguanine synthase
VSSGGPALPVVEVFGPTLQGEGRVIGLRTMFVRLAGCDWACSWCDTPYAWRPGDLAPPERLGAPAILERLAQLDAACRRVTLSGGNPALHDCGPLVAALHGRGYAVHVETQGSRAPAWLGSADSVTVSPKGPSSGMPPDWEGLAATLRVAADPDLKVVVFDGADLDFALEVRRRHPGLPLTLQAGNRVGRDGEAELLGRLRWLAGAALARPELGDVRVLPQLHVLLWGNRRGA